MEISENNLIKKLKRFGKMNTSVLRGIGDDGAVVTMSGGQYVLVQDAMVEHVHLNSLSLILTMSVKRLSPSMSLTYFPWAL